jgi:hypothetical protein
MVAPSERALMNSSAGVSFEENMISAPTMPVFSARINSGKELQSAPNPSACRTFNRKGLGVALTAKNSLNPAFQANRFRKRRAFSRMAFSS